MNSLQYNNSRSGFPAGQYVPKQDRPGVGAELGSADRPNKALYPAEILDGGWRRGKLSSNACGKLSSHAVVAAGHIYRAAHGQRKRFDNQRYLLPAVPGRQRKPWTLAPGEFGFLNLSVRKLARHMGCRWSEANAAVQELLEVGYIGKADAFTFDRPGLSAQYSLKFFRNQLVKRGQFEYVEMPPPEFCARKQHLCLLLQRHATVFRKRLTIAALLHCTVQRISQLTGELERSGHIEIRRQARRPNRISVVRPGFTLVRPGFTPTQSKAIQTVPGRAPSAVPGPAKAPNPRAFGNAAARGALTGLDKLYWKVGRNVMRHRQRAVAV